MKILTRFTVLIFSICFLTLPAYAADKYFFEKNTLYSTGGFDGDLGTEIIIPEGVTELNIVGDESTIESIHFPSTFNNIELFNFYNMDNLKKITISSNNPKYMDDKNAAIINKTTKELIFYAPKNSAESYRVPASVKTISGGAFNRCSNLKTITVPSTVETIETGFTSNCYSLTDVNVESGSKYVSRNGIVFNKDMTQLIYYPDGKQGAVYTLPESVKIIGPWAINNCNVENIVLHDGVETIENGGIARCEKLSAVNLPPKLTRLNYYVLASCKNLKEVSIGPDIKYIDAWALHECYGLEAINVDPANPKYESHSGVLYDKIEKVLTKYPIQKKDKEYTVLEGTKVIEHNAFSENDYIKKVILPEGLVKIDKSAFIACDALETINIPSTVEEIGYLAFNQCNNIKTIKMPNTIKQIQILSLPPKATVVTDSYYIKTFVEARGNKVFYTETANSFVRVPVASKKISIYFNGSVKQMTGYNIGGSNYFRMADIAHLLRDTKKAFIVGSDGVTIYEPAKPPVAISQTYTPVAENISASAILRWVGIGNSEFETYEINGEIYFSLRDLATIADFYIGYDSVENLPVIDSTRDWTYEG
ncbi:leucine-rich repeat domain-containing protein [Tyzzerella sp. OttesenSCG-928-J15]|nr:leucine-rich repeat domain-containing protein [Tyzzerella sp. OttesenSCG-928-J15]